MSHTQNKKRPQNSRLMIGGIPLSPLWACWECYQAGASDNGFVHITCSVIYTIRYNKIQYKKTFVSCTVVECATVVKS